MDTGDDDGANTDYYTLFITIIESFLENTSMAASRIRRGARTPENTELQVPGTVEM